MRNSFSRSLALLLLWLCFSSPLVAQPVTSEELVTELTTILTLLETARSESQTAQEASSRALEIAETLQSEQVPLLQRQQDALRISFDDYAKAVRQEIRSLRLRLYLASGIAVVVSVAAIVAAFQ